MENRNVETKREKLIQRVTTLLQTFREATLTEQNVAAYRDGTLDAKTREDIDMILRKDGAHLDELFPAPQLLLPPSMEEMKRSFMKIILEVRDSLLAHPFRIHHFAGGGEEKIWELGNGLMLEVGGLDNMESRVKLTIPGPRNLPVGAEISLEVGGKLHCAAIYPVDDEDGSCWVAEWFLEGDEAIGTYRLIVDESKLD